MLKLHNILLFLFGVFISHAQEVNLPEDLRQHNLGVVNSSLLSPVFSLDNSFSQSIALWTRWQWQSIDGDPTTMYLNYTRRLDTESAIGGGFFQHNTGTFLHTGGVVNYAYNFELSPTSQLSVGVNVFGFQRKLADDRFQPNPLIQLPQLVTSSDFILQLAPGIRFTVDGFSIGLASENFIDYNFSTNESNATASQKIYLGLISYEFPLLIFNNMEDSKLEPSIYVKTLPDTDTQFGLTTLLSTSKFWAQMGYNNFYGISGGLGGVFFKNLSFGALVEFGTDANLKGEDPTFEIVTAYNFGKLDQRKKVVEFDVEKEEEIVVKEVKDKDEAKKIKEELDEAEALAAEMEITRQAEKIRMEHEKRNLDSLATVEKERTKAAVIALETQKRQDSINAAKLVAAEVAKKKLESEKISQQQKVEKPAETKTKGRYEEVANEDGLTPGYYLIANVFGTKTYFEKFMKTLTTKGLQPKSFYRKVNKYNYVYLERYDTLKEAEIARDGHLNGRYPDKTWIFRVVGN